jgi:hypothetical protein
MKQPRMLSFTTHKCVFPATRIYLKGSTMRNKKLLHEMEKDIFVRLLVMEINDFSLQKTGKYCKWFSRLELSDTECTELLLTALKRLVEALEGNLKALAGVDPYMNRTVGGNQANTGE